MKGKKAQLQVMENIFVILIIFIILLFAFVGAIAYSRSQEKNKLSVFKDMELSKKSRILNFFPELQCSDDNDIDPDCYDLLKVESFIEVLEDPEHREYYEGLLGNVKIDIQVFEISPDYEKLIRTITVYDNPGKKGNRELKFPVLIEDVIEDHGYFGVIVLWVYL